MIKFFIQLVKLAKNLCKTRKNLFKTLRNTVRTSMAKKCVKLRLNYFFVQNHNLFASFYQISPHVFHHYLTPKPPQ